MRRTHFSQVSSQYLSEILVCTILAGPPGCGKTTQMLIEIATKPGRYLLAAPRIDLLEEHAALLLDLAEHSALVVVVIHSKQSERAVDRRLRNALDENSEPHIVVLTTHEGLMGQTPEDIAGWHVRIDELPETAVVSGSIGLGASYPTLANRYDLIPSQESGWSRLVPRIGADPLGLKECLADVAAGLVKVFRLANSRGRGIEVNIGAWDDAGVPGRVVRWRSIWSLANLSTCASLKIAAAGYGNSIIGHATAHAGGVDVQVHDLTAARTGQPRIRVHWYTRCPGTTTYWATPEGSACVAAIAKHLRGIGFGGYWTGNTVAAPYLRHQFGGVEIRPRSAGSNALRAHTACAIIYSCKATSADEAVMTALGLDRNEIRVAREDEDIAQAVTRGAIRDLDYDGDYDIHIYDEGQAIRLQERLRAGGYSDVTLVPIPEAGIMDVVRPMGGRRKKDVEAIVETAAAIKARKREAEKERGRRRRAAEKIARIQAGTQRGRGRPRRSDNPSAPSQT